MQNYLMQAFNRLQFDNIGRISFNNCSDDFEAVFDDIEKNI